MLADGGFGLRTGSVPAHKPDILVIFRPSEEYTSTAGTNAGYQTATQANVRAYNVQGGGGGDPRTGVLPHAVRHRLGWCTCLCARSNADPPQHVLIHPPTHVRSSRSGR